MTVFARERRGRIGYVDADEKWVIKPRFRNGSRASLESRLFAQDKDGWALFSEDGERICAVKSPEFWLGFSAGLAAVPGVDFIDPDGQRVISGHAYSGQRGPRFMEDRCALNDRWIDRAGTVLASHDEVRDFHDGRAAFRAGDRWGFADKSGRTVIEARFESVRDFHDGHAGATLDGAGVIDADGQWVIPPEHDAVSPIADDRVFLRGSGRWHLYTVAGEPLNVKSISRPQRPDLAAEWAEADPDPWLNARPVHPLHGRVGPYAPLDPAPRFSGGFAAVSDGELWGYVGLDGEWAIEPKFEVAGDVREGRATVRQLDSKDLETVTVATSRS